MISARMRSVLLALYDVAPASLSTTRLIDVVGLPGAYVATFRALRTRKLVERGAVHGVVHYRINNAGMAAIGKTIP